MRIASPFLPAPSSSLVTTGLGPVVHTDVPQMQPRRKRECASRLHGLPGQARQCRSEKVLLHRTFPRKRGSGFFLACWVPLPRWQISALVLAARLRARALQILSREARSRTGKRMRGVAPRCFSARYARFAKLSHLISSPPGLTRWSMQRCSLESRSEILNGPRRPMDCRIKSGNDEGKKQKQKRKRNAGRR
jgi:hypothetical protein